MHWGNMGNRLCDVPEGYKVRSKEMLTNYQNELLEELKSELLFMMHKKISKNLEK